MLKERLRTLKSVADTAIFGGFGTGTLLMDKSGHSELVYPSEKPDGKTAEDPLTFCAAVKYDTDKEYVCALLKESDKVPLARLKSYESISHNSGYTFSLDENITVSLRACAPVIPLSAADSGIPSASFLISVQNASDTPATLSLGAMIRACFDNASTRLEYDRESGAAMLTLEGRQAADMLPEQFCIATNADNFTYQSCGILSDAEFYGRFSESGGFLGSSVAKNVDGGASAIISCHGRAEPHGQTIFRIIYAWNIPCCEKRDGSLRKSYHTHYFADAASCASYCFKNLDRLDRDGLCAALQMAMDNTVPEKIKDFAALSLKYARMPGVLRTGDGVLSEPAGVSQYPNVIDCLFPKLSEKGAENALRRVIDRMLSEEEYKPSVDDMTEFSELLIKLYSYYRRTGNMVFLSESWVDIAFCAETLAVLGRDMSGSLGDASFASAASNLLLTLLVVSDLADILSDRKRKISFIVEYESLNGLFAPFFRDKAEKVSFCILRAQWTALNCCGVMLFDSDTVDRAIAGAKTSPEDADVTVCAALERFGSTQTCLDLLDELWEKEFDDSCGLYAALSGSFSLLTAFSGFEYDKNDMSLSFAPDEKYLDEDGTFRCFVSFDEAYGYVEMGVDYIELNLLYGEVRIRKFISPHRPYKVLYGGRIWPCDISGKTVVMDNNLTVTPKKKLTLLVDISK